MKDTDKPPSTYRPELSIYQLAAYILSKSEGIENSLVSADDILHELVRLQNPSVTQEDDETLSLVRRQLITSAFTSTFINALKDDFRKAAIDIVEKLFEAEPEKLRTLNTFIKLNTTTEGSSSKTRIHYRGPHQENRLYARLATAEDKSIHESIEQDLLELRNEVAASTSLSKMQQKAHIDVTELQSKGLHNFFSRKLQESSNAD